MASWLVLWVLLLASSAPLTPALPIVDPGLFVIMGVQTCRAGDGYCILGNNCTLDEDFLPDDRGGHCNGLRSAFTPSAEFICCRYNAEPTPTTIASPATTDTLEHREADTEVTSTDDATTQTTQTTDADSVTENTISDTKPPPSDLVKRTRIEEDEKFLVTVSEIPPSDRTEKSEHSSYEKKNAVSSNDIFKLITEGEWQISFRNNEVEESPDATTTQVVYPSDGDDATTITTTESSPLSHITDAFVEKEIIVGATQPPGGVRDNITIADKNDSKVFESVCVGDATGDGGGDGGCWLVRFADTRSDSLLCHGALLDDKRVITSAACAIRIYEAGMRHVSVRRPEGQPLPLPLESVAVHEDFTPKEVAGKRHDIGLVMLTGEQDSRTRCSICLAAPEQTLNASSCYTFAGNDDVTKHPCKEIGSLQEEDGKTSITCSLSENKEQIPSGAPLICGRVLAGVAFTSPKGTAFTPSAQLLPWVRWNLQKTLSSSHSFTERNADHNSHLH